VNVIALVMSFGMFGSVFLLAQYFQTVQHFSPLAAGVRTLPWTGMPVLVAPLAGVLSERLGGKALVTFGLALQAIGLAWIGAIVTPTTPYTDFVIPFVLSGIGMACFFVPVASLVLGSVPREEEGVASGTNNAFRELGGVLGVAVLAAVFSGAGGYASGATFVAGLVPAVAVGAAVVGVGALLAITLPSARRTVAARRRGAESRAGWELAPEQGAVAAITE
jgi:MFS family permease